MREPIPLPLASLQQTLLGPTRDDIFAEYTVARSDGDVGTSVLKAVFGSELSVFISGEIGETPFLGDDDVLATGEFVGSTTEGFDNFGTDAQFGADRVDDLTDFDAGSDLHGLTERVTHTTGQSIGTGA